MRSVPPDKVMEKLIERAQNNETLALQIENAMLAVALEAVDDDTVEETPAN